MEKNYGEDTEMKQRKIIKKKEKEKENKWKK